MILRPEQVKLLAMGLPGTPANIGSKSSNSTASTNTSNTYSTNTTTNSTYNTTDTTTQDRRLVTDHGIGISADASTITTSNSNNQSDSHNTDNSIFYQVVSTDGGAVKAATDLAQKALDDSSTVSLHQLQTTEMLNNTGASLLQMNADLLSHISDSNDAAFQSALTTIAKSSQDAIDTVASIAAKPINAQDPQHLIVIISIAVVAVVIALHKKG